MGSAVFSENVDLDFFTVDLNEDNGDRKECTVLYNTFDISYPNHFGQEISTYL